MKAHLPCILILSALLLIQSFFMHQETKDRQVAELQRDEAFELAQKAQGRTVYWFRAHMETIRLQESNNPNEQ